MYYEYYRCDLKYELPYIIYTEQEDQYSHA